MNLNEIKEDYHFNLITGKFEPTEALPLVSILYNVKVEHHNRKILRLKEMNKISYKEDEERVLQLEKECKSFKDLMKKATALGYDVTIKGDIRVQLVDRKE